MGGLPSRGTLPRPASGPLHQPHLTGLPGAGAGWRPALLAAGTCLRTGCSGQPLISGWGPPPARVGQPGAGGRRTCAAGSFAAPSPAHHHRDTRPCLHVGKQAPHMQAVSERGPCRRQEERVLTGTRKLGRQRLQPPPSLAFWWAQALFWVTTQSHRSPTQALGVQASHSSL